MKAINSYKDLKLETEQNRQVWLLLYKKGSTQSECAYTNFQKADINKSGLFAADVTITKDIHKVYNISSVPALLHFESGKLKNIIKGCLETKQLKTIFEGGASTVLAGDNKQKVNNVTVYSTPTCSWCTTIKRYFDEHQIRYRDIDVSKDQKAAEMMVRKSGQQGVPQTEINGQIVVGFDKSKINRLLNIN